MEEIKTPEIETDAISTSIIQLDPALDPKYSSLRIEAGRLLEYAQSRTITCDEDQRSATEDLSTMATLKKALKSRQVEYTKPVKEHLDTINQTFAAVTGPLDQADKITRDKILSYRAEQDRKRREVEEINRMREEAARREAALNEGEITKSPVPLPVPAAPTASVKTDVGNLGTMKVRKWRLVDMHQIPREYLTLNESLITQAVKRGIQAIPGIEIYIEESLRVTAR